MSTPTRAGLFQSLTSRGLLGIGIIAGLLRIGFALLPLSQHLLLLEDDAWMVTAIARNWALGRGITADGVYPTNGFHPLYPLTLGALPYLVAPGNLDGGFTASLVICALLATAVMWPLYLLTRKLAGPRAAFIAVVLYGFNPLMIRLTVNGMETAMALLLFVGLLYAVLVLDQRHIRGNLLLGILTAAMILARLDGALLFAAIAGARLIQAWWEQRLRQEIPQLGVYIVTTFLLLGPYFVRNRLVFGSFSPSSGTALSYLHSYAGSYALTNGLHAFYLNSAIALDWITSPLVIVVGLIAGLIGLWLIVRRDLYQALPLLLYVPLPGLYYGYLMQQDNPRYFVGLSVVLIVLISWGLARWWERCPSTARRGVVGACVATLVAVNVVTTTQFWRQQQTMPQLTQPTFYQAARWIRDNLPADTVLGAKNSGIYQYYSGRTVINLDGKLNYEILPALEARKLLPYIRAKGIRYLVDREDALADHIQFYSADFGPAPAHRLPTLVERLGIYKALLLHTLRIGAAPTLDRRDGFVPNRPLSTEGSVIKTFPRPNQATDPVVIIELKP